MKQDILRFISIVNESKVLNAEQKRELLDRPVLLPEAYRERIAAILTSYDERARAREERVGQQVNDATQKFELELDTAGVTADEKQALLADSRQHTDVLSVLVPAS